MRSVHGGGLVKAWRGAGDMEPTWRPVLVFEGMSDVLPRLGVGENPDS